jgi:hypothetical protein
MRCASSRMAMMVGRVSSTNGARHGPLTFPTTPGPVLPPTGSDVNALLFFRVRQRTADQGQESTYTGIRLAGAINDP